MYSGGLIEPLPSGLMPWPPKSNLSTILEIRLNLRLDIKKSWLCFEKKIDWFKDLMLNQEYNQPVEIH